jgi:hypothetical protein
MKLNYKKGSFLLISILSLILYSCVQSQRDGKLLIDSFEGKLTPQTVDFGAGPNSSVNVMASKEVKSCGEQSIKVEYNLGHSSYMWVARGFNLDVKGAGKWKVLPHQINWKRYNAFSFYMYGSNSGGAVAFDIKDAKNEMWRYVVRDDFSGWKEIICPLEEFFPRGDWQPDNAEVNQILDFPIMSFQFEPRLPGKGVYYFDCVSLVKVKVKREE